MGCGISRSERTRAREHAQREEQDRRTEHVVEHACVLQARVGDAPTACSAARAAQRQAPRVGGRRRQGGGVAHLAAWPRLGLAVEVQLDVWERAQRGPVGLARRPQVAQQVHHRRRRELARRAERQAAHRAHLLLELAGHARVEREVTGVVRPRRELVDQQAVVVRSRKNSTHSTPTTSSPSSTARVISDRLPPHRVRTRRPARPSRRGCAGRARSRRRRSATNRAVVAARGHDRHFHAEVDELLEHARLAAERAPRVRSAAPGARSSPAPCRRSRSAPTSAPPGVPMRVAPRRSSAASSSTSAKGVTGSPRPATNDFSRARCCVTCST